MKATTKFVIEINDDKDPGHNDYIRNEYELREEAKNILRSRIVSLAVSFGINHSLKDIDEFIRYQSFTICRQPKPSTMYYVKADAQDIISNYIEEIAKMLIDDGEASTDLYNDYRNMDANISESDSYGHNPSDAIEIIDELSEFEEEDSGLWEGCSDYSEILNAIAHYTYTNAVYHEIESMIESINDTIDSDTITKIEDQITKELLTEDDYQSMKEANIDIEDFDQVREWCEENHEAFVNESLERVMKAVKEEIK